MITTSEIDPKIKERKITDLLTLPVIVRVNKFNEEAVKQFTENMATAQETQQPAIPIVIDSYGGEVYSLLAMMDIVKKCKTPVATVVEGKGMSCGAVLATCGTEGMRFMSKNSTLMIHDVSSVECGKNEEIKAGAKEVERLNNLIYKILAENCGKHEKYFWDLVQAKGRADWYLNAEECKEHNIINHIRIPEFRVKITSSVTFE